MKPILPHCREMGAARDEGHVCPDLGERGAIGPAVNGMRLESQVRNRLRAGGRRIRTLGPPRGKLRYETAS